MDLYINIKTNTSKALYSWVCKQRFLLSDKTHPKLKTSLQM